MGRLPNRLSRLCHLGPASPSPAAERRGPPQRLDELSGVTRCNVLHRADGGQRSQPPSVAAHHIIAAAACAPSRSWPRTGRGTPSRPQSPMSGHRRPQEQMDLVHVEQPAPALQRRCSPNWPTWRAAVAAHIPTNCRLSDLETELEQFTMNVWGAPERVRPAHLANERAQFSRDLRSANMVARPPAPIRSKPSAAPANDALLPDNRNRAQDGRKPMIIQTNRKRSVLSRCGRFGARRRSTLICCRRIRISASRFALDLKSEAMTPRISLNRSIIRSQTYAVCSLRPC